MVRSGRDTRLIAGSLDHHCAALGAGVDSVDEMSESTGTVLACLRRDPEVAVKLLGVLAERLLHLSEMVEDTLFLNLPVRLAKKLLAFAESDGEKTPEGIRIQLRLSQEEWGDLVGATRESVNKQMRAWTEEGLIRLERGYVTLRRPDAMEALAHCLIG